MKSVRAGKEGGGVVQGREKDDLAVPIGFLKD